MDVAQLVLGAIGIGLGAIGVGFWGKIDKVLKALKELADVIAVFSKALEDKKLTPEEFELVKKEFGEAMSAFKAILK